MSRGAPMGPQLSWEPPMGDRDMQGLCGCAEAVLARGWEAHWDKGRHSFTPRWAGSALPGKCKWNQQELRPCKTPLSLAERGVGPHPAPL